MSDDKKETPKEHVSYSEMLATAKHEEKQKKELFSQQQRGQKFSQSPSEEKMAQAMSRLFQNDDFKTYIAFEDQELAALVTDAFKQPPMDVFTTLKFGEQMAFNKGRHHQMIHMNERRKQILKIYLNRLDNEVKIKEE